MVSLLTTVDSYTDLPTPPKCREAWIRGCLEDRDIHQFVLREARLRGTRALPYLLYVYGRAGVVAPSETIEEDVQTAVHLGLFRALLQQFSEERGLTSDWWAAQRRSRGIHGKAKYDDLSILLEEYPEFVSWSPETYPSGEQVKHAAATELRLLSYGHGTSYRDAELLSRCTIPPELASRATGLSGGTFSLAISPSSTAAAEVSDHFERLFDAANGTDNEEVSPADSFASETVLPILEMAISEFGVAGLLWCLATFEYPGRVTQLFRDFCETEDTAGLAEDSIRRDLQRRLPQINEALLPLIKGRFVTPTPAPRESVPAPRGHEDDRIRFARKRRARCLRYLRTHPRLRHMAAWFRESVPLFDGRNAALDIYIRSRGRDRRTARVVPLAKLYAQLKVPTHLRARMN